MLKTNNRGNYVFFIQGKTLIKSSMSILVVSYNTVIIRIKR